MNDEQVEDHQTYEPSPLIIRKGEANRISVKDELHAATIKTDREPENHSTKLFQWPLPT